MAASASRASRAPLPDDFIACGYLALPRRPVHFVSDIHGEAEAFRHLMRSCSGELRTAVAAALDAAPDSPEVTRLHTLLCYPREVVARARATGELDARWWRHRIREACRLLDAVCRMSPAAVLMPAAGSAGALAAGAEERGACGARDALGDLVFLACTPTAKHGYGAAVDRLVELGAAEDALDELAWRIRAVVGGRLEMVGDIWDRGARGDLVLDELMALDEVRVQWGNHDVCWMGAAAGDATCIATVLRNNLKYGNVAQFEEGYGISLEPLRSFAAATYADEGPDAKLTPVMKAISVLLFKCEGQAIRRHPEWHMEGRLLLDKIDLAAGTVRVGEATYPLLTRDFPTLAGVAGAGSGAGEQGDPYELSVAERTLMDELAAAFTGSARLQEQIAWLYEHGGVYDVEGRYLFVHGCVPMNEDGTLAEVACDDGRSRAGRSLLDWTDAICRRAWEGRDQRDLDWMGFFWTGWQSTFMGRVVKTFERTYLEDESTWKEPQDPYFSLTNDDPAPCELVLREFGLDPTTGVIVNGHTPVKLPKGQAPVRGEGRRLVIDGGFCRAYRKSTGIAGYTLVDDAYGTRLVTHGDFPGLDAVLGEGADMGHEVQVLLERTRPEQVGDASGGRGSRR